MTIRINQAGLDAVLRGPGMRAATRAAAEAVASNARAQGVTVEDENGGEDEIPLPVEVEQGADGAAYVKLAHPAGLAVQAKHGTLTTAAAQAGLDVRGRRS